MKKKSETLLRNREAGNIWKALPILKQEVTIKKDSNSPPNESISLIQCQKMP